MTFRTKLAIAVCLSIPFVGCDGPRGTAGTSCTVRASDAGVTIACDDGSEQTLSNEPEARADGGPRGCSVERASDVVTIRCADGTSTSFPVVVPSDAGAPRPDAGPSPSCTVAESDGGAITISCPDGTTATIPAPEPRSDGSVPPVQSAPTLIGPIRSACGACHDSASARAHFEIMTIEVDGTLQETCATCHKESSIEPVTRVHQREELGDPGLKIAILDAAIDNGTRKPLIRLRITDNHGTPLSRDGISWSMLIAEVPTVRNAANDGDIAGPYLNYIKRSVAQVDTPEFPLNGAAPRVVDHPNAERGNGTFAEIVSGEYEYTFQTTLPATYNAASTHMVGLYATRTDDTGTRFVANATRFFIPSGGGTPLTRGAVHTDTCNNCHNPLSAHGGSRQDVQLCLGCHTQGAIDPESGNSLDFNVMIHRIHRGKNLPSVGRGERYLIIGFGNSVHDFGEVGYPQPIENCQSCHTDTDDDRWVDNGVAAACTACHEDIYRPKEQGGHPFPLTTSAVCGNSVCHGPGGNVQDAVRAHKTFLNDETSPVFDIEIVSIAVLDADSPPSLRIRARSGTRATGAVSPVTSADRLQTLNVFFNGPNPAFGLNGHDIKQIAKSTLVGLSADNARPGEFTFSLPQTLRQLADGLGDPEVDSYTIGLRAVYDPTPSDDEGRVDMLRNPTKAFTLGDSLRTRAALASTDRCNACHGQLSGHGGGILAKNVEECALCHTATMDTSARQSANKVAGPTTSLRLSTLVHRLHATQIAEQPYRAFAFSATAPPYPVLDLSEVPFPGDVADCSTCHDSGTYTLPLAEGTPPTQLVILDADGQVVGE